ncbi:glycerophosphodiester phosphodiesterase [Paenibacillus caui]|uniref:glycerophosphodiester phosphodiesterase n=1 Tax=Paenibacillus caui TaxID=2873927 RepID=UPI001CA9847F|nr:glycerophosphodiester phosphodiesterase family protein [Paenibacillus caui]
MERYCAAHRGYSSVAPENTMAAVRMAMEEPCVKWIEVDVQMSRDGVPVVIHDFTVNRTTNGRGPVKEKTLAELKALDAGSWKSVFYAGEQIMTLDELLDEVKGRLKVNLEIKTQDGMYPGLEKKIIEAVRRRNMQKEAVLTSFNITALGRVKREDPEIVTGLITDSRPPELFRRLKDLGCGFLSIGHRKIGTELVAEAAKRNVQIMAWTVDRARTMLRLAALSRGILICTNRPNVYRETFIEPAAATERKRWWRLGRL